jgi:hypothetical protein
MPLVLGQTIQLGGDITTNRWVGARSAADIEKSLGFARGRLAAGWAVLVLTQPLTPDDFQFSGLTLRSGGRLGLPADDPVADRARRHVTEEMLATYGASGYASMQQAALRGVAITGPDRLVKVLPETRHDPSLPPSAQYPMGGGGLQWTLKRPCGFRVAMLVDAGGIARIPGFTTALGPGMPYEARARLARHIAAA